MALDFHKLNSNEYLFGLDDKQFHNLAAIFKLFKNHTSIAITQYDDVVLSLKNIQILIKIIDNYIQHTDLNINKDQVSTIIEFKGLLKYFGDKNTNLKLLGD